MDTIDHGQAEGRASDADRTPRSIQPTGFLLALTEDWRVVCASANVGTFLGLEPGDLIGASASTFLADDTIHALRNRLALLREPDGIERLFACPLGRDSQPHDVAIHIAGDQVIVEAELSTDKTYGDVTGALRGMMTRVDEARDFPGSCAAGARQVRALIGFDRVMVTRFSADGSREVVAETARASIGSYVGARIPASAIAAYERAAYRRSPLHVIADVEADEVAVVADAPDDAPDLSRAVLRSASVGQFDQLRAMDARASVSIALEVGDDLWGVISCHHLSPRRVSFERRAMAELFARMFAMRIEIAGLQSALAGGGAAQG